MRIAAVMLMSLLTGCTSFWTPSKDELNAKTLRTHAPIDVSVQTTFDGMWSGDAVKEARAAILKSCEQLVRVVPDGELTATFQISPDQSFHFGYTTVALFTGVWIEDRPITVSLRVTQGKNTAADESLELTPHAHLYMAPLPGLVLFGAIHTLAMSSPKVQIAKERPDMLAAACAALLSRALEKRSDLLAPAASK